MIRLFFFCNDHIIENFKNFFLKAAQGPVPLLGFALTLQMLLGDDFITLRRIPNCFVSGNLVALLTICLKFSVIHFCAILRDLFNAYSPDKKTFRMISKF